ncbi:hypothetical protein TNCV_2154501 [Trichonephila clavipes]|nr:hypothetical protein TNCV_2154501 [Trichonephila clavipes]
MLRIKHPPFGVMWKLVKGASGQVLSSSLNHGSELRDSSAIASVLFYIEYITLTHTSEFKSRSVSPEIGITLSIGGLFGSKSTVRLKSKMYGYNISYV